ncbi:MAG: hypothetical protein GXO37_07950, partial [Chloroflexi bacterium]|nr:hypothetical protein [Chloroflexota bacterium]
MDDGISLLRTANLSLPLALTALFILALDVSLRLMLALARRPQGDLLALVASTPGLAPAVERLAARRVAVQRAASAGLVLTHGL